ncbi:MAG: hypothetical protein ACPLW9_01345 [Minisyncoccales bacterium]
MNLSKEEMVSLEVKKQSKETTASLFRRFAKKVQQSGVLLVAREKRFHQRPKSKQLKRRSALRRETLKKEYEKLKKLGQLK